MDWNREARRLLKIEITRHDLSYKELVRLLDSVGVNTTERSLANKIARGTFSFAFFVQCMRAMGVRTVEVSEED